MKKISGLFLSLLIAASLFGQPSVSEGLINLQSGKLGFQPSADFSKLAFYNISEKNTCEHVVLNLADFSRKALPSIGCGALMSKNLTAMFYTQGGNQSRDTMTANFATYYTKDGSLASMKVFKDKYYTLGLTAEGNLICADAHVYWNNHLSYLRNVRIVNPLTGALVKTLYKGTVIDISEGALAPPYGQYSDLYLNSTQSLLIKKNRQTSAAVIYPLNGKPPVASRHTGYFSAVTDTVSVATVEYTDKTSLKWYGIYTGESILDTMVENSVWRASALQNNHYFSFNPSRSAIIEYAVKAKSLVTVKTYPIKLEGVELPSSQQYYLVVSPKASKIALFPKRHPGVGLAGNTAYIWEIAGGKLVHKINNFYNKLDPNQVAVPAVAEAPQKTPCELEISRLKIKPLTFVSSAEQGGMVYRVLSYNCSKQTYVLEYRSVFDKVLKTTSMDVQRFEMDLGKKYIAINAKLCPNCNGHGAITKNVNYSTSSVDNYNAHVPGAKVITTKSGNYLQTDICKKCFAQGILKQ